MGLSTTKADSDPESRESEDSTQPPQLLALNPTKQANTGPTMKPMTLRIAPIEPQWFGQKAQVQSHTWHELNQGHIPQEIVDAITPDFALRLTRSAANNSNQATLVALDNNQVIGFAELLRTPRPPINRPDAAELASLYVLTAHHRKGIGRMLVEAGKHAIGNDRLALWVMAFNANAQGFYRHIGFHETGHTQTEDMGPELEMINYTDEPNQQ